MPILKAFKDKIVLYGRVVSVAVRDRARGDRELGCRLSDRYLDVTTFVVSDITAIPASIGIDTFLRVTIEPYSYEQDTPLTASERERLDEDIQTLASRFSTFKDGVSNRREIEDALWTLLRSLPTSPEAQWSDPGGPDKC